MKKNMLMGFIEEKVPYVILTVPIIINFIKMTTLLLHSGLKFWISLISNNNKILYVKC